MTYFEDSEAAFEARYRGMSDEELIELAAKPWAMSDSAWELLEDEFDHRRMELPEPEAAPLISVLNKRDLVLLRRFRDVPEALLAKGKLDSSGVECFLADDNMVRMDWFISNLLGGIKLLVDAEQFNQAARILNEPIPAELTIEGIGEYAQPRCPKCGSLDTAFEELNKSVAYTSAWLGVPIPLGTTGWCCHECSHRWDDAQS